MPVRHRAVLCSGLLLVFMLIGGCASSLLDLIPEPKQMPLEVTFSGTVSDATDASVRIEGARVEVKGPRIWFGYGAKPNGETDHTGADGSYTVRSPRCDVSFDVDQVADYAPLEMELDLGKHADTVELDARVLPRTRTLKRVELAPVGPLVLAPGEKQQFTATVLDADGNPMADVTPTWAVSGDIGAVDPSGLLTAGAQPGNGAVIAALSSKMAVAVVSVEGSGMSLAAILERATGGPVRGPSG